MRGDALISLTCRDLALQVPLLVIQILQLQVQTIDLLARFSGLCLGVAGAEGGLALEASQLGEVAIEQLLLLGDLESGGGGGEGGSRGQGG